MDVGSTRTLGPCPELDLERHGGRPALVADGVELTHRELAARCDRVGDALGAGRRLVAVQMRNDVGSVVAYLGARRAGHVVLVAPPTAAQGGDDSWDVDVRLSSDGPDGTGWRVDATRSDTAHQLHPELALLLGTSGSTGSPKRVRLSQRNSGSNAVAIAEALGLDETDRALTSLPLHYCYGLSVLHSHLVVGAAVVLTDRSVLCDELWSVARRCSATSLAAVPHTLDLIERVGTDRLELPSLRRVTVAGGRTPVPTVRRFAEAAAQQGWDLVMMYGQTEATARMAVTPPGMVERHPGAIGCAVPGGEIRLAPVDGAAEGVGEIVYRGPNVMMGYAETPADLATGAVLDELRTGDLARELPGGTYEVVGRANRITKLFGVRVDLDHLETRLGAHGDPALCVELDAGVGVLTAGVAEQVLRAVTEMTGLPPTSVLVRHVETLPHTDTGKPDRGAARSQLERHGQGGRRPDGARRPEVASGAVRELIGDALGVAEVADGDSFVSLGGDSLTYVEVSLHLEELLGELPADWHLLDVAQLEAIAERHDEGAAGRPRRRHVETSLVLRAAAILLVVGSHAGAFRIRGGAHVLLAVAGFNFARFLLREDRPTLRPDTVRSIARIAVPASIWLAVLGLVDEGYGWPSVAMVNTYLGAPEWGPAWRYWFVEALVLVLLAATLLTSLPPVRRLERRSPVAVPALLLVVGLAARADLFTLGPTPEPLLAPHRVAWFFLLGWLIARAPSTRWRWVASAVVLAAVPGFFGEPTRDAVVIVGLLVLTWVPTVRVPRVLVGGIGTLAGASLYVYLVHYQVLFPLADRGVGPWIATAASVVVGVVVWQVAGPLVDRLLARLGGSSPPG